MQLDLFTDYMRETPVSFVEDNIVKTVIYLTCDTEEALKYAKEDFPRAVFWDIQLDNGYIIRYFNQNFW